MCVQVCASVSIGVQMCVRMSACADAHKHVLNTMFSEELSTSLSTFALIGPFCATHAHVCHFSFSVLPSFLKKQQA